ncbi:MULTISPECIES: M48 family metallopeptidase [unclassified Bifidobacterium]|uniref:M48 family metallopeptidase n=1 Tax=unclassified Bifidobacterium TaxID=2608897 RepID=UPI0015E29EFC|nr:MULTISPECIES: SprT family zinc-dependent metalloprotease [unclassified Bifidobacterium]TPF79783.1 metal-dependent hydrolase [Bifidobacterium sp. UTCIF-24]TPF84818.1 metal-dependent hydrolase [Bifidobacterium sp. UTCIF-36]TPF88900.1 metal-dependent hydrolase [Bifidobacterium sp. UTBIF-56]
MPYRPSPRSGSRPTGSAAEAAAKNLTIDGLSVMVVRKPIKNMYLRIKPPNGDIAVSAPKRMSDRAIIEFVRGRRTWIDGNIRKMASARERSLAEGGLQGACADTHTFAGTDGGAGADGGAGIDGGAGMRDAADGRRADTRRADSRRDDSRGGAAYPEVAAHFAWTEELRRRAAANIDAQLPALLAKWGPVIGRRPTHITLRLMTSRWGSCTPATGRIRLNLQLGLMEPRFLEYVLVHEMTHLWERGHGAGFQRRMTAYLPGWKALRRDLNRRVVL